MIKKIFVLAATVAVLLFAVPTEVRAQSKKQVAKAAEAWSRGMEASNPDEAIAELTKAITTKPLKILSVQ